MIINGFRDLDVWKLGKGIANDIYRLTKSFPKDEVFGITSQMRRAAVSIPSNIAEGFNRRKNREFQRFLYISYGSCAELETQIEISFDQGYCNQEQKLVLLDKLDHEERMIKKIIEKMGI